MVLGEISISNEELKQMKILGSGVYGAVRLAPNQGKVIKRYHEYIKGYAGESLRNPCLSPKRRKFRRLNSRNKYLSYSDTEVELVYDENGTYIGVLKKFYDGETLDKMVHLPLSLKKDAYFQLIRNSKELMKARIYNLDYKNDNVIYTMNGNVKIIDLDDGWTRATIIPNYLYKIFCLNKIRRMILELFYYNQMNFPQSITSDLVNSFSKDENKVGLSFRGLNKLVRNIEMEENIIIVKNKDIKEIDISLLKKYIVENKLYLVIAFSVHEEKCYNDLYGGLKSNIIHLKNNGIDLYDIFKYHTNYNDSLEEYITSHDSKNVYTYENEGFVYKKK